MITAYDNSQLGQTTVEAVYEGYAFTFQVNIIKATVTFLDWDGTVIASEQYAYGETVKEPKTPEKPMSATHFYRFTGWDKKVTTCAGDAVYTAVYEAVERTIGKVYTQSGDSVNIRKGPGTNYDVAYSMKSGTEVEIFDRKSDGSRMWGQLKDGNWICLNYVTFGTTMGDMDGNMIINEDDAIYLLRHVLVPDLYPLG